MAKARKPYTWSRKPTRTRRAMENTADRLRARARERARQAAAKLRGHKEYCRACGKTFRTQGRLAAHTREHAREREQARDKTRTKGPAPGRHSCAGCGKTFRNDLEFADHARQHAEREDRARARAQRTGTREKARIDRAARGGRPRGTPKQRGTRAEEKARWHAHRMQHAAGRVDRDGNRIPHEPSPRVVRPRERAEPRVR